MNKKPLFPLGRILATSNALSVLSNADMLHAINRHHHGDWGQVHKEDAGVNELSLKAGSRLLSVYTSGSGVKFWVITEADRSATTVLLPHDY